MRAAATQLILDEYAKCGGDREKRTEDMSICHEIAMWEKFQKPIDNTSFLHALYYRSRQQSAVWDIFKDLHDKKLVDIQALCLPIDLSKHTPVVQNLGMRLSCFEFFQHEPNTNGNGVEPYRLWRYCFTEPMYWLATVIIRGAKDVTAVLEDISTSEVFGSLNQEALTSYVQCTTAKEREFRANLTERQPGPKTMKPPMGPFGFWLPHGVSGSNEQQIMENCDKVKKEHFDRIEAMYKKYFDIPDEVLLLESQQDTYDA